MANRLIAPKTQAALEVHLPPVLADLAHAYLMPCSTNIYVIARVGHGEMCEIDLDHTNARYYGFSGACAGGHVEIAKMMMLYGANSYDNGLIEACEAGHISMAALMLSHGAEYLNAGLEAACRGGSMPMVKFMITQGAIDWNRGLVAACCVNNIEIAEYMISLGATHLSTGLSLACSKNHAECIKLTITHGAKYCHHCQILIGKNGWHRLSGPSMSI